MVELLQNKIKQVFSDLRFEERRHLYFWKGMRVPISVSGKVNEHVEKFNEEAILPYSAAKATREEGREVTTDELAFRWKSKRETACELGTNTHDFLEMYQGLKTPSTPQEHAGVKFLTWLFSHKIKKDGKSIDRYVILFRELEMYSTQYDYAGTADLVILDRLTDKIIIADYKTNADLFKTYKWLKPPFDYLENHPYNKYQLQLSYYQIIIEDEVGVVVQERLLVYLKSDGEYKNFPLIDFTSELRDYLNNNN